MDNEALTDVEIEGKDAFAGLGESTPSESSTEKEQEEVKPVQGKNTDEDLTTPFHKHPRWIERENELNALREKNEAYERDLADLKQFKEQTSQKLSSSNTKVPEWFSTLYGDNQEAWEKYSEHDRASREEIKREILEAQQQQVAQAQEQEKYWNKWVDDEMGKLESKGYKFDREELAQVILKTRPTDEKGNLDFEAGYETYIARKGNTAPAVNTQVSQARKQVADTINKSSRGEPAKKDYMTSAELRNKSWNQLT